MQHEQVNKTKASAAGKQNEVGAPRMKGVCDDDEEQDDQGGLEDESEEVVLENDNDSNISGELWLYNPSSTTYVKHFMNRLNHTFNSTPQHTMDTFVAGYFNTTSAINAVDFKMSSGDIDDGTITMYGIA